MKKDESNAIERTEIHYAIETYKSEVSMKL